MFQYIAQADEKPWQLGPYDGVQLKILHKNESTGAVTVLRKFAADSIIPAHTHPLANEWSYVLSGEWEESEKVYTQGTLFHAHKGERHGPHMAKTEVISLTHFDGPLTVE
jgi:quercetin dioxygenase-like cupin family protein